MLAFRAAIIHENLLGSFLRPLRRVAAVAAAGVLAAASAAPAQIVIPAANLGTDGALNPFQNRLITLGSAVTGQWDQPGDGRGVYDPEKWAVVYKYTSVSIPANVTVTFANHPSGAPVVWLVDGDVTINGTVNLNGQTGSAALLYAPGGPGGFRGGKSWPPPASRGFGPGGGGLDGVALNSGGEGGGFGCFGWALVPGEVGGWVYGTPDLVPLIGGSGGSGHSGNVNAAGGGGGGAILIAASGTITLNGSIIANGGSTADGNWGGGGSGGGIRLVCNTLTGSAAGALSAVGGVSHRSGGCGRIRTEANFDSLPTDGNPARSRAPVGSTARLWPDSTQPRVTAVSIGDRPVPADPRGLITFGNTDVQIPSTTPAVLTIHAANVPVNAYVEVRIVPATQNQDEIRVPAVFQTGALPASVWRASLPVSNGVAAITVTVTLP